MGMIGNQLAAGTALTIANDSFNGTGSATAFTLSQSVGAATDIEVLVDNVQQSPYDSSYSVSGTTLTFSAAPSAGTNNIYVIYNASKHISTNQVVPDDASVTSAKLASPLEGAVHIRTGASGATADGGADELVIEGSGNTGMSILSGASSSGSIYFGDSGSAYDGWVNYSQTDRKLNFATAQTTRMSIDDSGRVFKPNQPCFLATGNNGNYVTTSPIPFPTVVYNIGSHYNNSNYTFTAPVAGRYWFHAHIGLCNGSSGANIYPWFNVNGSNQQYSYVNVAATWYGTAHLTCIFNLSASDTVKVTASISSATYYNGANETRFMGYLIG